MLMIDDVGGHDQDCYDRYDDLSDACQCWHAGYIDGLDHPFDQ